MKEKHKKFIQRGMNLTRVKGLVMGEDKGKHNSIGLGRRASKGHKLVNIYATF